MSAWDVVDWIGLGIWLAWMTWFWRTMAGSLLNTDCPPQVGARKVMPAVVAGLVLASLTFMVLAAQAKP